MTRIAASSDMAIVALADPTVSMPFGTDQDALIRVLEALAHESQVFYLVTDDPVHYRLDVLAGEDPPEEVEREFEPAGGTFGLKLPSGQVAVQTWNPRGQPLLAGTVDAGRGFHALSVFARRSFEGKRHAEDMRKLLGAEWRYQQQVDRLGLIGCLPLVLLVISILSQQWRWLWLVIPLLALTWAPSMLLRMGRRYKSAEKRAWEFEQARPHYIFQLKPTDDAALVGGFLRV